MRTERARLVPLIDEELTAEQAEVLGRYRGANGVANIFRTMARAPKALKRFGYWGGYILSDHNSLAPRERELVILRTGYVCRSGYEWAQHVPIGLRCGLSVEEIERIKLGPSDQGWSIKDRTLLTAVDELVGDHFVTDETWLDLGVVASLSDRQKMDLVFTTGQYTQVSMLLNSFGVQIDDHLSTDVDLLATEPTED